VVETRHFSLLKNVEWLRDQCSFPFSGYRGAFFPGVKQLGHEVNCYLNQVLRLRMRGTVPLCVLYAHVAFTVTSLPVPFTCVGCSLNGNKFVD